LTPCADAARHRLRAPTASLLGALAAASLVGCSASHAAPTASPAAPVADELCFSADSGSAITASIYSLPSRFFSTSEAERLLAAVRQLAPQRTVVVLTDLPLPPAPGRHLVATHGEAFSPWPRDPFALGREASGEVRVVVRPNLQPGREADARLGEALLRGLPPELRRAWGEPTSMTSPAPFHNGQLLLDRDALWLSLHSVEPRALELLGLARVPVESFAAPAGAVRYALAARRAADELGELFGRPARFVHPLPQGSAGDPALMAALGGGAGFDLDSWLTLLRPPERPSAALVGDLSLGERLLPPADDPAWEAMRQQYGFTLAGAALRAHLSAAAPGSRAERLDRFLDVVAGHLADAGYVVERLPALLVPVALLGRPELTHPDFVLGWNNVVVERSGETLRAEGFASGLAPLDAEAERRFAAMGVRLTLLPPLVESVVRNGGYRCASNHLRAADCASLGASGRQR
jgi:hypothetical protein